MHGTFNVGGDGVLMLSQALRRLGRPTVPVPGFALSSLGSLSRQAGIKGLQAELAGLLTFGRGLDTSRMRSVLGFRPAYTTAEAFADLGALHRPERAAASAAAVLGGASRG